MKVHGLKRLVLALVVLATAFMIGACGGSDGPGSASYTLSGRVQKGPFAIGSQISVSELDAHLNPTGKVYNVQTTDSLGSFAVAPGVGTNLVEILANGFYIDERTGLLSSAPIQLRAYVDLSVDAAPTVNALTSLQAPRIKALVTSGMSFAAAGSQSQTEVLGALGIDATKVSSLTSSYSLRLDGSTDADGVLLATSVILTTMAQDAAVVNGTSQPAELSNYVNSMAAQIAGSGALTSPAITVARNKAGPEVNLPAVRSNLEAYYAANGSPVVAPNFEEWIDSSGSGVLPQRRLPIAGLAFPAVVASQPHQLVSSATFTVSGLGAGVYVPIAVDASTTILKNGVAVSGSLSVAHDADTIALQTTSPGYSLATTSTVTIGSTTATWNLSTSALSGTISGLRGTGLVLQVNSSTNVSTLMGTSSFSFPTTLPDGSTYMVSVLTQPRSPLQTCTVGNGTGTVGAAASAITVVCNDATGIAFVADGLTNTISTFAIDASTGAMSLVAGSQIATGVSPKAVLIGRSGNFVYVLNAGLDGMDSSVSAYGYDTGTGALTPLSGSPFTTVTQAVSVALDPAGTRLYVAGVGISAFTVDPGTGILSAGAGSPYFASATFKSMTFDPSGRFAFGASASGLSTYSIDQGSGVPTQIAIIPNPDIFTSFVSVLVDPSGGFLFVGRSRLPAGSDYFLLAVDASSGALSPVTDPLPFGAAGFPMSFDPTGRYLYLVMVGSSFQTTGQQYSFDPSTGALAFLGTLPGLTGNVPVTFEPSGRFAYSARNAWSFDPLTGLLTPLVGFVQISADPRSSVFAVRALP